MFVLLFCILSFLALPPSYWLEFLQSNSTLYSLQWFSLYVFFKLASYANQLFVISFCIYLCLVVFCSPLRVHTGVFGIWIFFWFIFCCCFLIKLFIFDHCSAHAVLKKTIQRDTMHHFQFSQMLTIYGNNLSVAICITF